MNIIFNIFGYMGGVLIIIFMIPQLIHTYKTKDVKGISYIFVFLQMCINITYFIYGIGILMDTNLLTGLVIIIPNVIAFLLTCILFTLKCKWNNQIQTVTQV